MGSQEHIDEVPYGERWAFPDRETRGAWSPDEQREYLLTLLVHQHHLDARATDRLRTLFAAAPWLGFGNPARSELQLSSEECLRRRSDARRIAEPDAECRAPHMVQLPAAAEGGARVCIDQYEFPNVPCEYPVVWVRASEARELCEVVGKRLCDAHEWEGACGGNVLSVEKAYRWHELPAVHRDAPRREKRLYLEYLVNRDREVRYAYGVRANDASCATSAYKSQSCAPIGFERCGTQSFPAGSFPECVSSLGVYDQHGNVAEHMSLPLRESELGAHGGIGWTEMKGSWFIGATHPDDCYWRAKNWHTTRTDDPVSHNNYHLGFRCCRDR